MGLKETEKIPYVELDKYAASVHSKRKMTGDKIALLFAEGEIVDGTDDDYKIASEDFVKQIRKVREDDKIKAVVMRVNSPGGSALASEVILRELQLLKQKKPLIVSMGDVAASGGYYISCQADSIFAMPNTITGSIGVFSMMFNIGGLMKDKAGISYDVEKNAPFADFPNAFRPLTDAEAQRMQAGVDTIYQTFKGRVAAGRRLSIEMVDSIAQGRVWTGTDALEIGLVDALGGLDRALKSAAVKAKLNDYYVVTYPEPVDKFESLVRRMKGNPLTAASVKAALEKELGADYEYYKQVQDLRKMNGRTQMAMPYRFSIE
jgi:protease-4